MTSHKAPTGRTIPAQGKESRDAALGPPSPQNPSPVGAGQLPVGWVNVNLTKVGLAITGNTPPTNDAENYGRDVPFVKPPDLENRAITDPKTFLSEKGATIARTLPPMCVLVTCIGNLGRVGINRVRVAFNQQINAVMPNESVHPLFLFYVAQSHAFRSQLESMASATTIAIVNKGNFEKITIPLPPLNEQKRIVSKIEELFSELDAGEESLRRARRQLGVYRQSLLKQAFEGKLTTPWRQQNPHLLESPDQLLNRIQSERQAHYAKQLKDWEIAVKKWDAGGRKQKKPSKPRQPKRISDLAPNIRQRLSELDIGWQWAKLGWMTTGPEYGSSAKSKKVGDCPVIRMGNIQRGEIDWGDLVYSDDPDEIEQYLLASGDVLFNRTNSPELVGKTAIYRGLRPAIFAGYLVRVNHIQSIVSGDFLTYFLNSHTARQYGNTVKTDGVNQSNINADKLINYPFPYCSLPEQQEIVRLLDEQFTVIDQNEQEIDAALKRSAALRQSILKKAFTGQLVPQDPTDEPASALLERIRRERELLDKSPKKKRAKIR
jgi:type I restriction enzyme S subunit